MITKQVITTDKAPKAVGPYSQAIKAGNYLFLSGQLPIDPSTGKFSGDNIETQTRQAIENVKAILSSVGSSLEHVVKTTVFLKNMEDFPKMNEVYQQYFKTNAPARSCVEVSRIPKDALVEVESIAIGKD